MKISTLETAKALVVAIKADAKMPVAKLVQSLRKEALSQGHEETAVTEFVKAAMEQGYKDQPLLFKARWDAARNALFHARKKDGNKPMKNMGKKTLVVSKKLAGEIKSILVENNITDKKEQRAALLALAAKLK